MSEENRPGNLDQSEVGPEDNQCSTRSRDELVEAAGRLSTKTFTHYSGIIGKTCYLAGPIDDPSSIEYLNFKEYLIGILVNEFGVSVYNPMLAWSIRRMHFAQRVQKSNHAVIKNCDFMIALMPDVPAYGTWRDIQVATDCGVPVYVADIRKANIYHVAYSDLKIRIMDQTVDGTLEFVRWVSGLYVQENV